MDSHTAISSPASADQLSLFGSPDGPMTDNCGAVASPARTSARPAKVRASKAPVRDCGSPGCGSSTHADPFACSLRMSLRSELAALTGCSMTWKDSGTPARRSWWVLSMSARPIDGIESGSLQGWATPVARPAGGTPEQFLDRKRKAVANGSQMGIALSDLNLQVQAVAAKQWPTPHGMSNEDKDRPNGPTGNELGRAVTREQWPTPTASPHQANRNGHSPPSHGVSRGMTLAGVVGDLATWPTPKASDGRPKGNGGTRNSPGLDQLARSGELGPPAPDSLSTNGKPRGSLNSRWVASLMGYPPDWCEHEINPA